MRRRFIQLVAACGAFLTGLFRALPALAYDGTISGNFAGVVPAGQHWHITGDVNLTGDLIVEGLLTGIDTFTLTGNGFQIVVQNGGRLDLAGRHRSGWVRWGDNVSGSAAQPDWQVGDRLAVSPTKSGIFTPQFTTWTGSWVTLTRPLNSPDVTLVDGRVMVPEVANLSQTVTLRNLRRIHFHDGAGVQTLKWLRVLDSGVAGILGDYPIHFHLNGEASRGSVVEGVTVENGQNHAFVAHASHGITFHDCAAIVTIGRPFWWDPPPGGNNDDPTNDSDDIVWDHCLVGYSISTSIDNAGFQLGGGQRNTCTDSVAYGIMGGKQSSGFIWPEKGQAVWTFHDCLAHNNKEDGIFTWQNDARQHVIERFTAYRCPRHGVEHGAYINRFQYLDVSLTDCGYPVKSNALSVGGQPILFEDVVANGKLMVATHKLPSGTAIIFRRATFTGVDYFEASGNEGSFHKFEDCGAWCVPAAFNLGANIKPTSTIEIWNSGVLAHRWAAGVWS